MSTALSCPSAEKLEDLLANRLPAAEAEGLRKHLSACPACLSRVRGPAQGKYAFLSPPRDEGELGWLDQYRVLGVLGEGGMAVVFDAEDTNLHRRVAIKVLRPEICDPTMRERFLREGRLVASLPHDHIVTIFQVGESAGVPYLVMEKLEGESLEIRLQRDTWLPLVEALAWSREATEGLAVAHERGLVHRDIKPANLWLETRHGRFRRVKLIDFGIARPVDDSAFLTSPGIVLGTPTYMAPEQAAGLPVDGRADLYSLGCVLYRMVTGQTPFDSTTNDTMAVLQAAIKGEAPRVTQVVPQLRRGVAELIQELLARDPEKRPASAVVLLERLRRLEQEERAGGAHPMPQPRPQGLARRLARRPDLIGIGLGIVAILAALIVGVVAWYHRVFATPPANGAAPPEGPPIKVGILHSLSGTVSMHERPIVHATRLALAEIHAAGGVLGRPLEIIQEDGGSSEDVFAEKARSLLEEDQVAVLFGCWTSSSRKRVAAECARHDRLLFYPAGHEGLEASPSVVYLGGTPNQTILPMLRWAYAEKKRRRFFLIGSEYVYSHAIHPIISHELKQLGAVVAGTRYVPLGEKDFTRIVEEIQRSGCDIIINSIDGESNVAFCQALRRAGVRPERLPTVWLALSESELGLFRPGDLRGDYTVGCWFESVDRPSSREFVARLRARYPGERVNDVMETAYAGVYLWKKAVEQAGSLDTEEVRQALRGLRIEAPEGTIRLDRDNQHAWRTARVGEVSVEQGMPGFRIVYASPGPLPPDPFPQWRSRPEWKQFLDGLYRGWGGRWEKHR